MSLQQQIAPVVLIIFNRSDLTRLVFKEITKARPPKLFIVADGPRSSHDGEAEKCAETRKIVEKIEWNCEVVRIYSDTNLGCKKRISSGLDAVFNQVDRAIILEDDCLPDQTFFRFCSEMLEYYKHDQRVGSINGSNLFASRKSTEDYYFSRYPLVWGWATWGRVWDNYDVEIKNWGAYKKDDWLDTVAYSDEFRHWTKAFDLVYKKKLDTWDYQFVFNLWSQRQVSVHPQQNLISNMGFRPDATHTNSESKFSELPCSPMNFPLRHPESIIIDSRADSAYRSEVCSMKHKKNLLRRLLSWN